MSRLRKFTTFYTFLDCEQSGVVCKNRTIATSNTHYLTQYSPFSHNKWLSRSHHQKKPGGGSEYLNFIKESS
jgi:hypothetical protein